MLQKGAAILSDQLPGQPGRASLGAVATVAGDRLLGRLPWRGPNWLESRSQRRLLYRLRYSLQNWLSLLQPGQCRFFPEHTAPTTQPVIRKKVDKENKPLR